MYLFFSFIFAFVDNLHHLVEHWEEESHESKAAKTLPTLMKVPHDDESHIKEMNQYITLFSILRMAVYFMYLYFEARHQQVFTYMNDNWLGWPSVLDKPALKEKVKLVC